MKQICLVALLNLMVFASYGQTVGLGIGSGGINVKSNHEKNWRFIGRLNFRISESPIAQPSLTVVRQLVIEPRAKLYVGGGISLQFNSDLDGTTPVFVRIPAGIEYFIFEEVPVSIGVEAGLEVLLLENNVQSIPLSLFELTYYLGQ